MAKRKPLDLNVLSKVASTSEVTENFKGAAQQNTPTAPAIEEENQTENYLFRRRATHKRKEYKNFSLSLELEDWIKFQQFLLDNSIKSGSEFIRELLREKGVL
ncbi:hypothetical protein [Campylobacter concisus]